jgi:hypothetical protein
MSLAWGSTQRSWLAPLRGCGGSPPRRPACLPPMAASVPTLGSRIFGETSVGQRPTEAEAGILTVFLGGNAASTDEKWAFAAFRAGLANPRRPRQDVAEDGTEGLDTAAVTSMFWSARLAASPPPKSDNTPRCRTRRGNQLLTAACNLPANIGTALSIP